VNPWTSGKILMAFEISNKHVLGLEHRERSTYKRLSDAQVSKGVWIFRRRENENERVCFFFLVKFHVYL